ncbi:porin [Boseongicola aestuarii]|uniref:Porin n=1 Tax=Boseongicola aestuarii TaxID=1470561 RepID=A0A238IXQ9_9RHOB|nr:porin [Boseongicola aestuarii]SMX23269.1 Porin [Boseongicola aestuarii]
MKKVILGTTALVLTAGVAFADAHAGVSVGGSAEIWVNDLGSDIQFNNDVELTFSGSGETDGGLGFGFDYAFVDGSEDNNEVYISGSWGKLTVGDVDDALQKVAGIGDIGFDGLGVDNVAELGRGIGDSNGVLYSNTIGAASIYLSMNQDTGLDDMAIGVSFDAGPVTIGIGYEDTTGFTTLGSDAIDGVTAVDLSGSFGAVGFDILWIDHDLSTNYGAILSYDAGVATIKLGVSDTDASAGTLATVDLPGGSAVGVGFETDLGGGASLSGGVVDNDVDTVWDLGIGMSF